MPLRLMLWIEDPEGFRVEVVNLAPGAFKDVLEAELHVFNGEGGVACLELWAGGHFLVERDRVEAVCGWEEP